MPTFIDTHVHFYPSFSLPTAINACFDRVPVVGPQPRDGLIRVWMLADRQGQSSLDLWRNQAASASSGVAVTEHAPACVELTLGQRRVFAVSGRQLISSEGIEILTWPLTTVPDRALTLEEALKELVSRDSITILPWSPGKWRGARLGQIENAIERYPDSVWLGDTPLRVSLLKNFSTLETLLRTPKPLVAVASQRVLWGSDPLPLPHEDSTLGSFGIVSAATFAPTTAIPSLRSMLSSPFTCQGARNSLFEATRRWTSLALRSRLMKRKTPALCTE